MQVDNNPMMQRLKGLMLFRVLLVTLFLGGAIFLNAQVLSDLSTPRNSLHLGLIIATYVLTIIYALLLKRGHGFRYLPHAQLSLDLLLSATLILTTGGLRASVFLFTLYLPIIGGAFVINQRWAMGSAVSVAFFIGYLALVSLGVLPGPNAPGSDVLVANARTIITEASVNITFAFLLAWSSGQLAKQLGEAKSEIAQRQGDLRELQALNENILSSLNSGLITIDKKSRIIFFNVAAEHISGVSSEDVFNTTLEAIFPDLARQLERAPSRDAENNPPPRFEGNYAHPDGHELYLGFSISSLLNAAGEETGQIIIFQDLSQIKALEEQAKLSERMAAIGHLSAAIAHEIRNPLASISGSVEMLQSLAALSEDESALMGIILREVERLNGLISQFLEYSRPRILSYEETDLSELVRESLQLFRHNQMRIHLTLNIAEEVEGKLVPIDREAIKQIVWNLLNNASDAMSQHPDISGELPEIPLEYPLSSPLPAFDEEEHPVGPCIYTELAIDPNNAERLQLIVEDDGPGISEEIAERIFEPFFTTKTSGTGLGLATIYRLIEDHGGHIHLTPPRKLSGARFVVDLPASHAHAPSAASSSIQNESESL